MRFLLLIASLCTIQTSLAQDLSDIVNATQNNSHDKVTATFKGFRIVNLQTIETAKKHNLFFNIAHRFGDLAGDAGGISSFYGFDNSSDIRTSFDYGITDRLQAGIGRSKGIDPLKELYDANLKFKLLEQTTDGKLPFSVTVFGSAAITGRKASVDSTSDASFSKTPQRLSYVTQLLIAKKFSPGFSLQIAPTWSHRNYVAFADENDLFAIGAGGRLKLTSRFAIIADYYYDFSEFRKNARDAEGNPVYYDPLSVGVEIETGGHVFTINFTNATGIVENLYLPFTTSNWLDGEFRLGFNIARNFVIGSK
jgi:hypothetical protein